MWQQFKQILKRSVADPWHWMITKAVASSGSAAGASVTPDSALRVSAVYACVNLISETLASLPLQLFERVTDGKQPAASHPLYSLLHDAPNDYMTAYDFRECQAAHLNLNGNSYTLKLGNGRGIKSLIPLSPERMEVERSDNSLVYRYTHEDGRQEEFPADKIWHVKRMPISCVYTSNAPEGLVGLSPIAAARESIGLAMAADQYGAGYFRNNAQVGLNLQFPGKLSENAKAFLKESLANYSKPENRFKSIITEEGGKIEPLGITNEDSQFLESRQFQIEEIARIFRVPPILLGHPTNTMTYASAEQLFLAFGKFTVLPFCRRLEQSMNASLLTQEERKKYFFEHNLDGLLRADTATRYTVYSQARQWGLMNVDEIRAFENMNPLPGGKGKIYLQPMNMVEAGTKPTADGGPPTAVKKKPGNGETDWKEEEDDAETRQ